MALCVDPEVRLSAFWLTRAREAALEYPIMRPEQPQPLLGETQAHEGCGHRIRAPDVVKYLPPEWFPIENGGEFVSLKRRAISGDHR